MNQDKLLLNKALPYVMHIDLNSCFAIIEQQANRLLRGRPVAVPAYDTPRGMVIASSYEAKAKGIKLGVNVQQARQIDPRVVILTPDPAKYREAHRLFKKVLLAYTPDVHPKSIDEFVLDFESSLMLKKRFAERSAKSTDAPRKIHNRLMRDIALEIKRDIAESLGEYVTVNIGISTNRFLAKYAAGFGKPDGMLLIDHANLRDSYRGMSLVDLPGINLRYKARLRAAEIYTPLDFLDADMTLLRKRVFKSINGYHWYRRLKGYEADAIEFQRRSIGHQYALSDKTTDMEKLERLLIKLCEKTGRRLRRNDYCATGIHLYLGFESSMPHMDGPAAFDNMPNIRSWSHGEKVYHRLYSTPDIYDAAKRLLRSAEIPSRIKIMSVHVFGLEPWTPEQLNLFQTQKLDKKASPGDKTALERTLRSVDAQKRVSDAVDAINDRYGEFVVVPGAMTEMSGTILDRIAFGQVHDM